MALRNPRQDPRRQRLEQLAKLEAIKQFAKPAVQPTAIPVPEQPIKVEEAIKPTIAKKANRNQDIIQQ